MPIARIAGQEATADDTFPKGATLIVFTFVVLGFCWWMGEQTLATKIVFTVLVLASVGLLSSEGVRPAFMPVQCVFIAVIGASTFGVGWLSQRMR